MKITDLAMSAEMARTEGFEKCFISDVEIVFLLLNRPGRYTIVKYYRL